MQIANVIVVVDPANQQHKRGVTPAECMILATMHRAGAVGTPLKELEVVEGEAVTIDHPAKQGEAEYFDQHIGRNIPARDAVPEKSHKRTDAEEISRLKRKYTGVIKGKPAFEATFGSANVFQLPQTFNDVEKFLFSDAVGQIKYLPAPAAPAPENEVSPLEVLMGKTRAELLTIAVGLGLEFKPADNKETIATAILAHNEGQ